MTGLCDSLPYGDLKPTATAVEKSVGQTWSDPAVGQVVSGAGPYSILLGSGFLPYATQQQANRGGAVAGTTFYILDAKTGAVYASANIGSDGVNETVNNCASNPAATGPGCKQIKNALQTDPVATGPSDQRYITKAYFGDLDGNVWRFSIGLDASLNPTISASNKLYAAGSDQPIFNSMATVNVGSVNQLPVLRHRQRPSARDRQEHDRPLVRHPRHRRCHRHQVGRSSYWRKAAAATVTVDERVTAFPLSPATSSFSPPPR